MMSFVVTLAKISQSGYSKEMIKDYTFSVVQLMHMLFMTLQGQSVVNSNDAVIESVYEALWYNVNKKTRLLLVLALRNCISPPTLSAGGMFILNLESFSNIMKASLSYFTVLRSS
ncbi:PREDICTED: uncharacterized protein LOC108546033 [Eufriesea mexicana]|uniref:uncharacterized protein LOC108546033 n=1 Tax=Eufriesea mexicana TaxID=516756 RepID=UPI00083C3F9F|nr:PREDICTED: uncharacterized protein LOC108546033 [Eufriesea mexicana]